MSRELEFLEKFYSLAEKEEYHEAHEVMEDYWREVKSVSKEDSLPFKGLINGSTAFVLHSLRRKSYQEVWKTYLKYCDGIALDNPQSNTVFQKTKSLLESRYENLELI